MALLRVTVADDPGATGLGLKLTVVPEGTFDAERFIGVEKVPICAVVKVITAGDDDPQLIFSGAGVPNVKPLVGAVSVKLLFEISKKIFSTASTFILAVVEATGGMVTNSVPSFGVLAINTVG